MRKSGQSLFLNRVLAVTLSLSLIIVSTYSQNPSFKVSNFKLNNRQPVMPGNLIASCIVQEGGDIPYKRYALVYIDYDGSNNLKMVLEKTIVQWGGWDWVEIPWFSPVIEKKSCRVNLGNSECVVVMAEQVNIRLKLIDGLGGLRAKKEE